MPVWWNPVLPTVVGGYDTNKGSVCKADVCKAPQGSWLQNLFGAGLGETKRGLWEDQDLLLWEGHEDELSLLWSMIPVQVPCQREENLHCCHPRWDIPQFRKSGIFSLARMGSLSTQVPWACLQQNWCSWPIPSLKNNWFCLAFFKSKPYSTSAFSLTDLSK